jgi:hypothetical protein
VSLYAQAYELPAVWIVLRGVAPFVELGSLEETCINQGKIMPTLDAMMWGASVYVIIGRVVVVL